MFNLFQYILVLKSTHNLGTERFLGLSICSLKIFEYIRINNWKTQILAFNVYIIKPQKDET